MLRFVDGFAHYSASQMLRKWTATAGTISSTTGRFTGSKAFGSQGSFSGFSRTIDSQSSWIIGFAFNLTNIVAGRILWIFDSGGSVQLLLSVNSDQTLTLYRGNGSTALATSSSTIPLGSWVYIELKFTINSSTGSYTLRINGANAFTGSGANTQASGLSTASRFQFFSPGGTGNDSAQGYISDLYICDGQGSTNNDFLGDCRVETLYPTGAGNYTQLTIGGSTPAATNWQGVKETPADDDVTYNYTNTLNQIDTYQVTDLTSTPTNIFGIQFNVTARKDNSGGRAETPLIRISGTDYLLTQYTLTTSYLVNSQIKETSPATSSAWSASEINSAEFGLKLTA